MTLTHKCIGQGCLVEKSLNIDTNRLEWYLPSNKVGIASLPISYCPFCGEEL